MASTDKTTNLQLNNWRASDKPKRDDFNSDNLIIDELLGGHIIDNGIHVTASEKTFWNSRIAVEEYMGTGADTRKVNLGYEPKFVIVGMHSRPGGAFKSSDGNTYIYSAIASKAYNAIGLEITTTGFTVSQSSSPVWQDCIPQLNQMGMPYFFIAIK